MAIRILAIGDSTYSFFREAEAEYLKRLDRYGRVSYSVIKGVKGNKNLKAEQFAGLEGREFLRNIKPGDYVILLDEKGRTHTSVGFADQLEKWMANKPEIVFVIGGAYGFSEQMYERSDEMLALSGLTFSHQMVRMIFLEQLYRGFTILNREPYHNV